MKFLSWKEMAARRGTSISTEKRLYQTDPRYPKKTQLSPGRVGFAEVEADEYDLLLMAGRNVTRNANFESQPAHLGEVTEGIVDRLAKKQRRSS